MKRPGKRWLLLLLPLILLLGLGAALYLSSFDNSNRIARSLLFQNGKGLDEGAFNAALNARFPKGEKPAALIGFIGALDGSCSSIKNNRFACTLFETGTFCVSSRIVLAVRLDTEGLIETISVKKRILAC